MDQIEVAHKWGEMGVGSGVGRERWGREGCRLLGHVLRIENVDKIVVFRLVNVSVLEIVAGSIGMNI